MSLFIPSLFLVIIFTIREACILLENTKLGDYSLRLKVIQIRTNTI
jgi:hypothetical protein